MLPKMRRLLTEAGIPFCELGGVVPNPLLSKVREGIALCRREGIDFILAVGGGSVIDSSKAIGYGVCYDGDVWDFWDGKAKPTACLPIGAVLTIPAAGSEMSDSCVISHELPSGRGAIKRGVNSDLCRCRFAIMNPERTFTLPPYQTAAGATDIMMHTMERYFTPEDDMTLTDALAEALMRTVKDCVRVVLKNAEDYRARAQIMWAGSLSHNNLMECGTMKDFASHKLEHELSALFGVTHGAGLAAIWPSWARYMIARGHAARFAQFAVNVMGVTLPPLSPQDSSPQAGLPPLSPPDSSPQAEELSSDLVKTALHGVEAMEQFYHEIGMPTTIRELLNRDITDEEIETMVENCSRGGTLSIGSLEKLGAKEMKEIYEMAK